MSGPGPRSQRRWTRRESAVGALVVVYIVVQITVPLVGLVTRGGFLIGGGDLTDFDGRQVRYGWQMFSTISDSADHEVHWRDGTTSTVNSVHVLGRIRGRAHHADVSERLCDRWPTAVTVTRGESVHRC